MGYSYQKGFGWPHVLFVVVLLGVLIVISTPLVLRKMHRRISPTLNHAKGIAGGLTAFKEEYGAYPSAETRELLEKKGFYRFTDHDDANAYLAQLIIAAIIDDEAIFHAPEMKNAVKGDNEVRTAEQVLSKGENSFAYVMTFKQEPIRDVSSFTPLVIAPLVSNGIIPTFDPEPFAGKYVYGAVDGSGKVGDIGEDGRAVSKGREHLFQTGTDSLFGDEAPVIKSPR